MHDDLKDIIEQLRLERSVLKDGGYGRSVRTPWKEERLFRDSITCLNLGEDVKSHPCSDCFLWEFVPPEDKHDDIPCHSIPLTETGETIKSLESKGDQEGAEKALLEWLNRTIQQLEDQLAGRNQRSAISVK
jgi:hypothetical protein